MSTLLDKYTGALFGLAVGDAIGTTVEFQTPGTFLQVTDMTGGGPFNLQCGEWTDDTSMMLCLAASLVETKGFDPGDQMARYVRWYRSGYMSSNGSCFDIGNTVLAALRKFEISRQPFSGSIAANTAGNGSLMRLAPVPLAYRADPAKAIEFSGLSSRTTHGAAVAVDACRYFAALLVGALSGASKADLLSDHYSPVPQYWQSTPLVKEIALVAAGSFKAAQPPVIRGSGYAAHALEAALWAFHNSTSFEEGCLLAVNLGDDADTTAAIYGQIAGAFYGAAAIPAKWTSKIAHHQMIADFAVQLLQLSASAILTTVPQTTPGDFASAVASAQAKWSADKTEVVLAYEAIAALPLHVSLARQGGVNSTLAVTFGPSSYTRPQGAAGIHPGECRPEWLHDDTAAFMVYNYCLAAGLNPVISRCPGHAIGGRNFAVYAAW
jgi:ADP-ribosylglycohydrolase